MIPRRGGLRGGAHGSGLHEGFQHIRGRILALQGMIEARGHAGFT
jgi:hypothetical protein